MNWPNCCVMCRLYVFPRLRMCFSPIAMRQHSLFGIQTCVKSFRHLSHLKILLWLPGIFMAAFSCFVLRLLGSEWLPSPGILWWIGRSLGRCFEEPHSHPGKARSLTTRVISQSEMVVRGQLKSNLVTFVMVIIDCEWQHFCSVPVPVCSHPRLVWKDIKFEQIAKLQNRLLTHR